MSNTQHIISNVQQAMNNTQPIAIIGLGCHFPGANNPQAFWQLLKQGQQATQKMPSNRWPDTPSDIPQHGGFLATIDTFDAPFFGISPQEAISSDPQQRLLLEVTWQALEHAGIIPVTLSGTRCGVFVGSWSDEYKQLLARTPGLEVYQITSGQSAIAGWVSHSLNLRGPSLVINTGTSSSLVAVHTACQNLRDGDCDLALAGGVNLMVTPTLSKALASAGVLAPDGRCKTFSDVADGYGRGEGCGLVVLKRFEDALADGDQVYAVIMASSVGQDGRTSSLLAPNGKAQEQIINRAISKANLNPNDLSYIETHGTGTPLGDVTELTALANIFSKRAIEHPLLIGSVKTNIGHLEAAAGIASLIKTVLALHHQEIPPHLNVKQLNPKIDWDNVPIAIPQQLTPWPQTERGMIAGVSSFGSSGTNAHVILQREPVMEVTARLSPPLNPPPKGGYFLASPPMGGIEGGHNTDDKPTSTSATYPLIISAKSQVALNQYINHYYHFLSHTNHSLADITATAALKRTHFDHRAAFIASNKTELLAYLADYNPHIPLPNVAMGQAVNKDKLKTVFVFPGQGSQWIGMGRLLYAQEIAFRAIIDQCAEAFKPYVTWSLLEELHKSEEDNRFKEVNVVQPTLFAMQVALVALWRFYGVEPNAVVGHSMGEIAAAYVAGGLTLEDAAHIICTRSQTVLAISGQGAMGVVNLSAEEALAAIKGYEDVLDVGVRNSPDSSVLSGDPQAMAEVFEALEAKQVFCRLVKVDYASHSPQIDVIVPRLLAELQAVIPQQATLPIYSTVTNTVSNGLNLNANYWGDNIRQPVRFWDSIQHLLNDNYTTFIEISPHPILYNAMAEGIRTVNYQANIIPTLHRGQNEQQSLLQNLSQAHCLGYEIAWYKLYNQPFKTIALPTYPFQHQSYWVNAQISVTSPLLQATVTTQSQKFTANSIYKQLKDALPNQKQILLETYLQNRLSQILGRLSSLPDINCLWTELNVDSLRSINLINIIKIDLNVKLSLPKFSQLGNIKNLASYIVELLTKTNLKDSSTNVISKAIKKNNIVEIEEFII